MFRGLSTVTVLLLALLVGACADEAATSGKTYPITGKILSRNEARNLITVHHDPVEGLMEEMVMTYRVDGQKVADLPADQERFEAELHVTGESYWLSNVKRERTPR